MNSLYLMIDEKRDFALVKVGFTTDLKSRLYAYSTHNPFVVCRDTMRTQPRSERKYERMVHEEMARCGYQFARSGVDNKLTEWVVMPYDSPLYANIKACGLKAFKCLRNKKSYGEYANKRRDG